MGATRIPGCRSPSAHGSYHLRCRRRPISCAVVTAVLDYQEKEPEPDADSARRALSSNVV
jgi:hypothetical protein